MKYILVCLFAFITGVTAQENPAVTVYSSSLTLGEVLKFNNRSVVFKNVVSDSRCPKDVTCVWAGEAIVTIEIFENGTFIKEQIIKIQSSNIPLQFPVGDMVYSISNLSLYPYPTVKRADLPKNYMLQMSVRETVGI